MTRRARWLVMPGFVGVTAGLALIVALSVGAASGKIPANPWAGLTDQQKQAQVDAAHAANAQFLNDFQARHGDPRSLAVIKVSTYAPPVGSVGTAAAKADLIAHGHVDSVHFMANPTGGMPTASVTVTILNIAKGSAGRTVSVSQLGGPVAQPGGRGALVELEFEHLMLPGDEVILLLTRSKSAEYRAIYGAGILLVQNGKLSGESSSRYGVSGMDYPAMWIVLSDPGLSTSSYPLRDNGGS